MLRDLRRSFLTCFIGAGLLAPIGCQTVTYEIVLPKALNQRIDQAEIVVDRDPLEYHFRILDGYLLINIESRTSESLYLIGEESAVIDPAGASHPIPSTVLQSGSQLKLVLPPAQELQPADVRQNYGANSDFGPTDTSGGLGFNEAGAASRYGSAKQIPPSWQWPEHREVQLVLTFQIGDHPPFTQRWTCKKESS